MDDCVDGSGSYGRIGGRRIWAVGMSSRLGHRTAKETLKRSDRADQKEKLSLSQSTSKQKHLTESELPLADSERKYNIFVLLLGLLMSLKMIYLSNQGFPWLVLDSSPSESVQRLEDSFLAAAFSWSPQFGIKHNRVGCIAAESPPPLANDIDSHTHWRVERVVSPVGKEEYSDKLSWIRTNPRG